MERTKTHKMPKALKVIAIVIGSFLALAIGLYFLLTANTQIIVGMIQKGMYGDSSPNTYEPLYTPGEGLTAAGQYKINDIAYGTEYPNSFLDITYPDSNTEIDRPTLFYFHGGGFFGGSKNMGDPMAASEATALLDDICAQGYNIVNVDYALVPDYHFPVPLVQANQAISFIDEHKDEYHINMDNVILMGSSAGAIMTAQFGTVISNPEYAALLNIEPVLSLEQVSAVIIDDAPIDYGNMTLTCKLLIGNYVKGSIYLNKDELNRYECIPYMTSDYPAAFLLGSEYRNDMVSMSGKLKEAGVEHILVDPFTEHGEIKPHCFVANERNDPIAKEAFDRMITFLYEKTNGGHQ